MFFTLNRSFVPFRHPAHPAGDIYESQGYMCLHQASFVRCSSSTVYTNQYHWMYQSIRLDRAAICYHLVPCARYMLCSFLLALYLPSRPSELRTTPNYSKLEKPAATRHSSSVLRNFFFVFCVLCYVHGVCVIRASRTHGRMEGTIPRCGGVVRGNNA